MGILILATGALALFFASQETSLAWVEALLQWWQKAGQTCSGIKRLVIYLDNGPHNSGRRRPFLKRLIDFVDATGLELRLVYYPPYHSKYNPIERCWSALEKKWGGALLNSLQVILYWASRMTWQGKAPAVQTLEGEFPYVATIADKDWKPYAARLERSTRLPNYDIVIRPKTGDRPVH